LGATPKLEGEPNKAEQGDLSNSGNGQHHHRARFAAHSTRRARIDNQAPRLILSPHWGHSSPEWLTDSSYRAVRARSCGLEFDALDSQSTVRPSNLPARVSIAAGFRKQLRG
jgi:hypothetical protein